MSRLVDTTICPDCRGLLDSSATCTACGLRVSGPLALQLWHAMVRADGIVEQLRAASAPMQPARGPVAHDVSVPAPPAQTGPPAARHRWLPAASVPVVLLSLGALCLLVAAAVFVAVTWGLLGLTGRTLVLLAVTAALAAVAVVLTRKSLRGAAETFWLIVSGMLVLDLVAARSAGLFGLDALGWRGTGALVGGTLLVLGTGVGVWARRQPVSRLDGVQAVAVIGALVVCATNVWAAENSAVASTVAVPLLGAAFVLLRRLVPLAAYGLGTLAAATWLVLLGVGWERALDSGTLATWWSDVRGWPLLAAALLAAVVVHAPGVPDRVRPVVAGLALVPLVLLGNGPQTVGTPTRDLLVACGTLLVLSMVSALAPRAWARGAAALVVVGIAALSLWLAFGPWQVLSTLRTDGRMDPALFLVAPDDNAASWSNLVAAFALVLAAAGLHRHLGSARREAAVQALGAVAPAVVALGALVLVLELEPALWAGVLAGALATATAGAAAWWSRDRAPAGLLGSLATAYLALVTLYAASAADLLLALTTTTLLVVLGGVAVLREHAGAPLSAGIAGSLSTFAGGWALLAWGQTWGAEADVRSVTLAVYAGLVAVLVAPLARHASTRVTLELSSVALAVIATISTTDQESAAMVLTIAGSAVCLVSVTHRDRALLSWAGTVVLGGATLLRYEAGVGMPELYTLPAAALLVAAGAYRLRRDADANSFNVLGSGLVLALLPSLLIALDEPVSLRGALIGAGGVLVLAAGVQQRLAAPFVLGALTTAVLAVRHLGPVAEAVPRWISLGGVGLALLVVGITWEARRSNIATAQRYLTALR